MSTHGLIRYVHEAMEDTLQFEQSEYAKFTVGMASDALGRIIHAMDNHLEGLHTPPKLLHATVKTFASTIAVIIMELSREGYEDMAKRNALDHIAQELNDGMEMYKKVLETMKEQKKSDFI